MNDRWAIPRLNRSNGPLFSIGRSFSVVLVQTPLIRQKYGTSGNLLRFHVKNKGFSGNELRFRNSSPIQVESVVLQNLRELRQTQIDRNRFKSAKIDSGRFCSTKSTNTKSVKTNIKSVFRILVLVLFVLQNLPESILADLNRFRSIWVCLNSQRFCSTEYGTTVRGSRE